MLIKRSDLERIVSGEVSCVFRRWQRPTVKAGGTLRTVLGTLAIEAVDPIDERLVKPADARQAGYPDRESLLNDLQRFPEGQLYRIQVRFAGPDERIALRSDSKLTAADRDELDRRMARYDAASRYGPWTGATLQIIGEKPATRAGDLATVLGVERIWFKTNVRKLKALGLTESLEVGYRLSPRGRAYLARRS